MGWCSVRTCKRNSRTAKREGKNLKFFGPPLDPEIRRQWIIRCDRKDNKDLLSRRVCSLHFKIDDFEDGLQARLLNFEPKRLKKGAIPSLELPPEVQERISDRTKRMQVKERKEIVEVLLKEEHEDQDSIAKRKEEELHEAVSITDKEIKTCCIRGCRNTSSELLMEFYPFSSISVPPNWIIAYCKKNLTLVMDSAWICSAHFKEEAFITEVTDSDFVRTLTKGILPTLNLPDALELHEKCARIEEENKELEKSIAEEELDIKALEKLIKAGKAELNRINKEVDKESVKEDIKRERELLSKVFSKSQIRVLSGRSKTHWKDDEMAVAYTIRHLSNDRAYLYLQTKLNIPLPGLSSIRKWINHKGDTQNSTTNER